MPVRTQAGASAKAPSKIRGSKVKPSQTIEVEEGKASVSYTISITKNLGKFESLKIQAGITIPYGANDSLLAELDNLLVVSREKVVTRLQADLEGITETLQ